ncbi:MAG: polyprenyl synthetase family protein [Myxococcales bacterium]|nr:polyprenyl synthetase family protein [Myxococcales bacterium]
MPQPVIPESSLDALQEASRTRSSARPAGQRLDGIQELLGEALPAMETAVQQACRGPEPLDQASAQLVMAGGKRVRPITALLICKACGGDPSRAVPLAASVELIHSATLLHDDVMDEGEERRGRPASRLLWGNLVSVLSGDLLLTSALQLVLEAGIEGAMQDTLDTMQALIAGEVAQLEARGRQDLGVEGYLEIARGKTASLFACACRLGARAAGASDAVIDAVGRFGERVGIAFQIVDDVLDLEGIDHEVGKRLGHDLAEGKTTMPLALALKEASEELHPLLIDARAGDTLAAAQVSRSQAVRDACVQARGYAARETDAGLAELDLLPEGRERDLLEALVRSLIDRRT